MGTEYFKHGIYSPFFFLQNAVCFIILTYLVPVLFTFYIQDVLKFKKNISGAKRLTETLHVLLMASIRATCPTHLTILDLFRSKYSDLYIFVTILIFLFFMSQNRLLENRG